VRLIFAKVLSMMKKSRYDSNLHKNGKKLLNHNTCIIHKSFYVLIYVIGIIGIIARLSSCPAKRDSGSILDADPA